MSVYQERTFYIPLYDIWFNDFLTLVSTIVLCNYLVEFIGYKDRDASRVMYASW
jgi:hypothetical protein